MSSANKNLSQNELFSVIPPTPGKKYAIVVSEWNHEITSALRDGAYSTLISYVPENDIEVFYVPGSFELTFGAQQVLESNKFDAVICLGCVIQGETRHFDFICQAVSQGITQLTIQYKKPVIFGVLTTDNVAQAKDRAGGKHGNKGVEAAATALKAVDLMTKISNG
ncbi:MAG: 6,7-dimethyl-8-ribityllumazine synthase [Bacteroidia bacterium]|nr:6,7-dimethyl-8-ribityllumazine synthase [Bacteroidia bacterium]MCZ2249822.1 6,7-dimethyl-8-ribityllumazine synthase [Bacteroidia bacterium]